MSTANNSPLSTLNDPLPTGYKQTEVGIIPEDWDDTFLGEITKLMTNGFVGTATSQYTEDDTGVLYIQGYNVEENSFNFRGVKFVNQTFHKAHSKSCLREGDLLTVQTGDVGLTTIVPKTMVGANCHALIISRFQKGRSNSRFISYYLNSMPGRARLKLIEVGTTMKHLNVGDMLQFKVPLPPTVAEQEAIAGALSDADALIESLEQLIAKKRRIKEGAMQTLLSGKKRLPGFSGEWGVKTLGEVLRIGHGRSQQAVIQENGQYPILATGGQIGRSKDYIYNKPTVLIGRKGTINKPQYMDTPFWSVDTLFYTIINEPNSAKFLYYRFCLIDWMKHNEASGVPSLNAKTIESLEVKIPEPAEQTAIAEILSDMDSEIDALEAKLRKARQIKQGMMQELLTGKTRLV